MAKSLTGSGEFGKVDINKLSFSGDGEPAAWIQWWRQVGESGSKYDADIKAAWREATGIDADEMPGDEYDNFIKAAY